MSTAVDQTATIQRTRESSRDPGEQHTVTRKTCVFVINCHPRVTFDAPSQTRETAFNKDEGKHGQREILERRDIRQVPNKRYVEVQSQNRDLLIRDVCTCLAPREGGRRGREGGCRCCPLGERCRCCSRLFTPCC